VKTIPTTKPASARRAHPRASLLVVGAATLAFASVVGCDGDDASDDGEAGAPASGGSSGKGGGGGKGGGAGKGGSSATSGQGGSSGKGGSGQAGEGAGGDAAGGDAAGGGGHAGDDAASGNGGTGEGGEGNTGALDPMTVFRHDTFGSEQFWTDQLRLHEFIQTSLDPTTALSVGLKVDADVLPEGILETVDLTDPATTVALLQLGAVVGVKGTVDDEGNLLSVGITCALCHSIVDDSVMPGIGSRIDGPANRDLDPGLIISLAPGLADNQAARDVYASWGKGRYDARYNQDGINAPVLIPPIYGLDGVPLETYTGDGPVSYWNAYVAVTQMGGQGVFFDPRIGVQVFQEPDLVTPKLPALFEYEMSLVAPEPPAGSFNADAAARGQALFAGAAQCATCHSGEHFTDAADSLHAPEETGMDPVAAERSATGNYRTTPLRALFDHPPYFHDGSAATLPDVVTHYVTTLSLTLSETEQADLVEYLKSL
jgi:hypothetical protein